MQGAKAVMGRAGPLGPEAVGDRVAIAGLRAFFLHLHRRFTFRTWLLLVFLVVAAPLLVCEATAEKAEGRRAALVIGNSAYDALTPLPNAVNDAKHVGEVLARANFEVTIGEDLTKAELEQAIREFLRSLNDGDVALFYYSGHAVQVAGVNFILPVDASLTSSYDLELESYNISNLLDYMQQSSSLQILVLDACRDNPFRNEAYYLGDSKVEVEGKQGLASLVPRRGSLIVYSTAPDQAAYDGAGSLSPFTNSLVDHVLTPNIEVRQLLTDIRADVISRTAGRQVPWDVSSLTSPFYFVMRENMLMMEQSLTEIRVSPDAREVRLDIPTPVSSDGMALTASFDQAPRAGRLMLDGQPIEPGAAVAMERLADVVYTTEPGEKSVELIPYSIAAATGQKVSGAVALVFDPTVAPAEQPALSIAAADTESPAQSTEAEAEEELEPVQLALAPDVGTGFVTISDALPPTSPLSAGWYRVEERAPSTQIALDARILSEGDLVKAEDVTRLAIRPALRIIDTDAKIVLTPATASPREKPVVIQVNAELHACDRLAGDPLDIQGVVEGVYPNDIGLAEAEAACREAVSLYPAVPRFKHQLGRVLYAKGEYDQAIAQFQAALDAGHVRSGQLLGRFYQLGAGVKKEPEKAIPLFQAAAERGDAYAQHSLGLAFLRGNGTEVDVQRGIQLLTQASESGHTYAMNGLGAEYLYGERVAKDPERALRYFRESYERGDIWGAMNLALLYRDGVGLEQDTARAKELLMQAHQGLHPYAGRLLALMLREEGSTDQATIFRLFRESAERGDAWSAFYAAEMMRQDKSLMESEGEDIRLLALAVGRDAGTPSERAREALAGMPQRTVNMEIQRALVRFGAQGIEIDGAIGPRTREAIAAVLGSGSGASPDLLGQLIAREWMDSNPRLDML
jgi:TPR repeat protein